jgi:hypothetical protein
MIADTAETHGGFPGVIAAPTRSIDAAVLYRLRHYSAGTPGASGAFGDDECVGTHRQGAR